MPTLEIICPYCGEHMTVATDGLYTPRYYICTTCSEKFIYEPLRSRVASYKLGEADSSSDPELREIESSAHEEQ